MWLSKILNGFKRVESKPPTIAFAFIQTNYGLKSPPPRRETSKCWFPRGISFSRGWTSQVSMLSFKRLTLQFQLVWCILIPDFPHPTPSPPWWKTSPRFGCAALISLVHSKSERIGALADLNCAWKNHKCGRFDDLILWSNDAGKRRLNIWRKRNDYYLNSGSIWLSLRIVHQTFSYETQVVSCGCKLVRLVDV